MLLYHKTTIQTTSKHPMFQIQLQEVVSSNPPEADLENSKLIIPVHCDVIGCLNWYKLLYRNAEFTMEACGTEKHGLS